MTPIDQTIFGIGKGNCFQACLASIFDLPLNQVPDVMQTSDWKSACNQFLSQFNLYLILIDASSFTPLGYYILSGKSPRGDFLHSVVALRGEVVHDPHPSRAGILSHKDVCLFVRLFMD